MKADEDCKPFRHSRENKKNVEILSSYLFLSYFVLSFLVLTSIKGSDKSICFFYLETTGISIVNDRIVEISVLKIQKNSQEISKTWLVNPTIPIPKVVSSIHGITDEMVKDQPTFKDVADEIFSFMKASSFLFIIK